MKAAAAAAPWWTLAGMLALPVLAVGLAAPTRTALLTPLAALGLAVVTLIVARPAWGAYALIVLVYWNASDVVTDTWSFAWLLRLLILLAAAAGLLERLLAARPHPWRWPLWAPLGLYAGAQLAAAALAGDRAAALAALSESGKGLAVFFLVASLLASPRAWRRGLTALLGGVALLSLPVFYQGISGSRFQFWGFGAMKYEEIVPGDWGWRLAGAVADPNFLAMVLVAALPLAAVLALEKGGGARRLLALAALVSAAGATVFTYSRAALLGAGFVLLALLWRHARRGLLLGGLAAMLAVLAAVAPPQFFARMVSLNQVSLTRQQQEIGDTSIRIRRNELLTGWLMFEKNPLLGVGPGNYESEYLRYSAWVGLSGETGVRDPHSLYIQIAAETGLAGLAAFAYLLWATFRLTGRARRRLRRMGAAAYGDLIWALELALATYLLLSIFLHGAYFRHFMLLLALAALGAELALESRPAQASAARVPVMAHD